MEFIFLCNRITTIVTAVGDHIHLNVPVLFYPSFLSFSVVRAGVCVSGPESGDVTLLEANITALSISVLVSALAVRSSLIGN